MMRYFWPGMYGYGGGDYFPMIAFWILIIGLVVLFARYLSHASYPSDHTPHSSRALEILKERYVKGEITKKEYEDMKKDIS